MPETPLKIDVFLTLKNVKWFLGVCLYKQARPLRVRDTSTRPQGLNEIWQQTVGTKADSVANPLDGIPRLFRYP